MDKFSFLIIAFVLMLKFTKYSFCENRNLVMTHIVYRHGDRSPIDSYPKDPTNESFWPQGYGQLSKIGISQHYELGKYLRERYILGQPHTLLSGEYSRFEVQVNSTDYDRTLMSASSNLQGLYPSNGPIWHPIPVHTKPHDQDEVFATNLKACPEFMRLVEEAMNSPAVLEEEKRNADYYAFIEENTGLDELGLRNIWVVRDTLLCESRHNVSLPDWSTGKWNSTNQTVFDKMGELESYQFSLTYNRPKQRRLSGGPMLKIMLQNMRNKISEEEKRKAVVFSGHDESIAAVMSALHVYNNLLPPYAACLMVELYAEDDSHSVGLFYLNNTLPHLYNLTIPGCRHPCPFDKFVHLTSDSVPGDWRAECQAPSSFSSTHMVLIASVTSASVLIILLIVVFLIVRKQRSGVQYQSVQVSEPINDS